jgi:hypothetical protein
VTSLHYYFPWAIGALAKWTVFCVVTGRSPRSIDLDTGRYFEVGDDPDRSYADKLAAYRALADEHFEADRYQEFCDRHLAHADEVVLDWIGSDEFDLMLVDLVTATYPTHEHEQFIGHFRGLVGMWVTDQSPAG